jgi:hypothetical protein
MRASTTMKWPELNLALTLCCDEVTLRRWLKEELKAGGPPYRALRIYGRLSAVRREREIREILRQEEAA